MRKCIVCLNIGERLYINYTLPNMKKYASKTKSDLFVSYALENKRYKVNRHGENDHAYISKVLVLYDLLNTYDRVCLFDDTCFIVDDCPNLFDIVPIDYVGGFVEGTIGKDSAKRSYRDIKRLKDVCIDRNKYLNGGVLVVSKCHQYMFSYENLEKHKVLFNTGFPQQAYISYIFHINNIKIFKLKENFNRMRISKDNNDRQEYIDVQYILDSNVCIWHITGWYKDIRRMTLLSQLYGLYSSVTLKINKDKLYNQSTRKYTYENDKIDYIYDYEDISWDEEIPKIDEYEDVLWEETHHPKNKFDNTYDILIWHDEF